MSAFFHEQSIIADFKALLHPSLKLIFGTWFGNSSNFILDEIWLIENILWCGVYNNKNNWRIITYTILRRGFENDHILQTVIVEVISTLLNPGKYNEKKKRNTRRKTESASLKRSTNKKTVVECKSHGGRRNFVSVQKWHLIVGVNKIVQHSLYLLPPGPDQSCVSVILKNLIRESSSPPGL